MSEEPNVIFTIPPHMIKNKGKHVNFSFFSNGAKAGELCLSTAEFKLFKDIICDDTMHEHNFELLKIITEHQQMIEAGWEAS